MSMSTNSWYWHCRQQQQPETEKILVSACLVGKPVRYNGHHSQQSHSLLQHWYEQGRLVVLCPEVAGGLAVPREPAERQPDRRILTVGGDDVTHAFRQGAEVALRLVKRYRIRMAVLKESSPSCGSQTIYDGHFHGRKIDGEGLTCERLRRHGVRVFNEHQLDEAGQFLAELLAARTSAGEIGGGQWPHMFKYN